MIWKWKVTSSAISLKQVICEPSSMSSILELLLEEFSSFNVLSIPVAVSLGAVIRELQTYNFDWGNSFFFFFLLWKQGFRIRGQESPYERVSHARWLGAMWCGCVRLQICWRLYPEPPTKFNSKRASFLRDWAFEERENERELKVSIQAPYEPRPKK